jgi:ABC-type dipeptide/oligopeptide/nickel transport system ATPase subunit
MEFHLLVEQNAKAALRISERCYVMETGRILTNGSAQEMSENDEVKAAFLDATTEKKRSVRKEVTKYFSKEKGISQ